MELEAPRVWVLVGDMTVTIGLWSEFCRYSMGHELPIYFVEEDNGLSTKTPTSKVWGMSRCYELPAGKVYHYQRTHPHVGLSERVNF